MSTGQEIADEIKQITARTRAPGVDAILLRMINGAIRQAERKATMFWFTLTEANGTTPADTGTLTGLPPADFLKQDHTSGLTMVDDEGVKQPCAKDDRDIVLRKTGLSSFGTPFYSLDNEIITIRPLLTVSRVFHMMYHQSVTPLATLAANNAWTDNADEWLIGAAGERYAVSISSPKVQYFTALKTEMWQDLQRFNTARMEAARARVLGD